MREKIRRVATIVVLMMGVVSFAFSSTRGDVKVIEAAENIQYLSQKIAIEYFFYFHKQKDIGSKKKLSSDIKKLEYYISEITHISRVKDGFTKYLLNYFTYRTDEIKLLLDENITKQNAKTILKHSEGFLEGAQKIIEEHKYQFSKEEEMLMLSKKAQYLVEKVMSYYMALKIGLNSDYIEEKMKSTIFEIDEVMQEIDAYKYSFRFRKKVDKLFEIWRVNRDFFTEEELSLPFLLLESTTYIQEILVDIELYHKKNL